MKGVIVDCYSSAKSLAKLFVENNVDLIHVQSSEVVPDRLKKSFSKDLFLENIIYDGSNLEEVVTKLQSLKPNFLLAGSEPGVELADALNQKLSLAGNMSDLSSCRRNKFLMMKQLRSLNVNTLSEIFCDNIETLNLNDLPFHYPVIVKPANSAASEDVFICETESFVRENVQKIIGKKNAIGVTNVGALIQEKLEGDQYMVNTVSHNGKHFITDVWREVRQHTVDKKSIYDYEVLLTGAEDEYQEIVEYVLAVVDGLGVRNGPAHTELYLTTNGPRLLESTSRLQGGIDGVAVEDAIGESQISLTFKKYFNPEDFLISVAKKNKSSESLMLVNFIAHRAGIVTKDVQETLKRYVNSVHSFINTPNVGDHVEKTIDLLTKPGHVYLIGKIEDLYNDLKLIRDLERENALMGIVDE